MSSAASRVIDAMRPESTASNSSWNSRLTMVHWISASAGTDSSR